MFLEDFEDLQFVSLMDFEDLQFVSLMDFENLLESLTDFEDLQFVSLIHFQPCSWRRWTSSICGWCCWTTRIHRRAQWRPSESRCFWKPQCGLDGGRAGRKVLGDLDDRLADRDGG